MSWRSLLPYTTVLSLAGQSARWEHSMQQNLWKMAKEAAKAAELQESAASHQTAAEEFDAKAAADETEGEALEAEGEALVMRGEEDSALAIEEQVQADGLASKAAEEQAAAAAEFGEAAAEETLVEENVAKATADAAVAARDGFEAKEDELAVGACEVIPVLDVVCDVVGGIAAVGLEAATAREAAKAAAEYAAAVGEQVEEESLMADATELQASAVRDGEAAAETEAAATELEAKAEEEIAEGREEEAAGNEKLAESAAEDEAAEEQEGEAAGEEEASASSFRRSLAYGASAWWDAMLSGLVSLVALNFFTVRVLSAFILPGAKSFCFDVAPKMMTRASFPVRSATHAFHHLLILGLLAGLFGNLLIVLETASVRSRGGILLEFAATAAIVQSLLLHSHSNEWVRREKILLNRMHAGLLVFVRCFLALWPLFLMEILLLRVNLGPGIFSPRVITLLQGWHLKVLFAVTLLAHFVFIERREWNGDGKTVAQVVDIDSERTKLLVEEDNMSTTMETVYRTIGGSNHNETSVADLDLERDGVLVALASAQEQTSSVSAPKAKVETDYKTFGGSNHNGPSVAEVELNRDGALPALASAQVQTASLSLPQESTFFPSLWKDLKRLVFPFELLVASFMFALLRQSFPNLKILWPASKPLILAAHPHWQLVALGTGVTSIATLVICLRLSKSSEQNNR